MIVQNIACPECQKTGHDHRGSNLMVFSDGARYCNREHWHSNGLPLYIAPDGDDPIMDMEVDGSIKYTLQQFKDLQKEGKLDNPMVREIALSGMRGEDRWSASTEQERSVMKQDQSEDHEWWRV